MRNHLLVKTVMGAIAVFGSIGVTYATSLSITNTTTTDTWEMESGQSIPTGTAGFVGGTLVADTAGYYTFVYGGDGLLAGDTGHGNSEFPNEFWVGPSEAAAEAAGDVFCTQAGDASCGGVASVVGAQFTVLLSAGDISFGFTYGPNNTNVLLNGQRDDANGAYLDQIGLGTMASAGPGTVAYLGLSDSPYPADHDFQDLVVTAIADSPEPGSLALLGTGLLALAFGARRRRNSRA